jgi:hypothetical protein
MLEIISGSLLGASVMFGSIWAYGRVQYWKGMYENSVDDSEEILQKALNAEKQAQAAVDKFNMMAQMHEEIMKRPVLAALEDRHVQQIASVLAQLVVSQNPMRISN